MKAQGFTPVAARLKDILDRGTSAHISLASFVEHDLRLPDFPPDAVEVLENVEINLFEAKQLALLIFTGLRPVW